MSLTQFQLAERAGVSRALVSAVEAGRHLPRIDAAIALARVLRTTAEALFGHPGQPLVDAISGTPPAAGSALRVGFVGGRPVSSEPRFGDEGWRAVDGVAGDAGLDLLAPRGPSAVVAGCEPGLAVLEQLLWQQGTIALAIATSSASGLAALVAGRLHAAAVHFPCDENPVFEEVPTLRVHLARWRVGLAAPKGSVRRWWQTALSGRGVVIQRESAASAQQAFERAVRPKKRRVEGPRVRDHLTASRRCAASGFPAVTIEPAAAAVGASFHPLETHDVELWVHAERAAEPGVVRLLELVSSARYRKTLECVGAYDLSKSGSRVG